MTSKGAEKMNNDTIGVDVSKDHLDADRLADGATRRFANDKRGHGHLADRGRCGLTILEAPTLRALAARQRDSPA